MGYGTFLDSKHRWMILLQQESFAEKVIYRLIRRHIAGPTMNLAIKKAKEINEKGLPVSLTFLSSAPSDRPKANYITNTYMQLARELARIGIKGSIDVPIEQLGATISEELAVANAKKVVDACRRCGIFVWMGINNPVGGLKILKKLDASKGIGLYFNGLKDLEQYANKTLIKSPIKVACRMNGEKDEEKESLINDIIKVANKFHNIILFSPNESIVAKLLNNASCRKSLIFEFQLGYSSKKLSKMLKRGAKVSINIPFGKDWINYAINNVPEGYMRLLANTLLGEEKERRG